MTYQTHNHGCEWNIGHDCNCGHIKETRGGELRAITDPEEMRKAVAGIFEKKIWTICAKPGCGIEIRATRESGLCMQHEEERNTSPTHLAQLQAIERAARELAKALQDDNACFWEVTNRIERRLAGAGWIANGRGSYEYNDDRYREETGILIADIRAIITELQPRQSKQYLDAMRKMDAALKGSLTSPQPEAMAMDKKSTKEFPLNVFEDGIRKIHVIAMRNLNLGRDQNPNPVLSIENKAIDLLEFIESQFRNNHIPDITKTVPVTPPATRDNAEMGR